MKRQGKKSRRGLVIYTVAAILFLAGLAVILYPSIGAMQYRAQVDDQKDRFEQQVAAEAQTVETEPTLPFEELYQELKHRNELLFEDNQKELSDPFSYEQPGIDLQEFGLEGNVIGFLSVPKMDIELPILLGANKLNMREGATHLTGTSYPIGGENTNCVLAAHRAYPKAPMFRDIEKLEMGDEVIVRNFRETLTYRVVEKRIVSPADGNLLFIQEGRDLVTLVTCHPSGSDKQRYVVFCERDAGG